MKKTKIIFGVLSAILCALGVFGFMAIKSEAADLARLLPSDMKIATPSPDLPKELAAFLGKWEEQWDGYLPFILVVEEINEKEAKIIYAVDEQPRYRTKASCNRYDAKVVSGKKIGIEFYSRTGAQFYFEMQDDLNTLKGFRFRQGSYMDSKNFTKVKRIH